MRWIKKLLKPWAYATQLENQVVELETDLGFATSETLSLVTTLDELRTNYAAGQGNLMHIIKCLVAHMGNKVHLSNELDQAMGNAGLNVHMEKTETGYELTLVEAPVE